MRGPGKTAGFLSLGLALAALGAAGCVVVGSNGAGGKEREFHFVEPLPPGGRVELKAHKGEISITGWDKPEVDIRARVRPGDLFWGGSGGKEAEVEVERWGDTVRIRSRSRQRRKITIGFHLSTTPFVDYEIRVPRRVRLELEDYKSSIRLANLAGQLRVDTYKGDLALEDFRGALELETYKGWARLNILDLTGDSAIETYKGDVRVRVNPEDDFSFEARLGRRADFRSDFPVEVTTRRDRRHKREHLRGTVGSGRGPRLTFESYKGTLSLTR